MQKKMLEKRKAKKPPLRGIIRKCHAHATHLESLDSALKDLGPIGHFRNPPRPARARGMALSRKVEGDIFDVGV